jgi:hypothetical protein
VVGQLLTKALGKGAEVKATPLMEDLAGQWAALQAKRLNTEEDEDEVKGRFAQVMSQLGAAKVKGSIGGKNWSVSAREGKTGTKTNHVAVAAIFQRMLLERGAKAEDLDTILADNTVPTETSAFIQGYFNSINKDRKAIREATKAAPLSKDLSA